MSSQQVPKLVANLTAQCSWKLYRDGNIRIFNYGAKVTLSTMPCIALRAQKEPTAEPTAITAISAMIGPTIAATTISR